MQKLKSRAHILDEWPYISDSACIFLAETVTGLLQKVLTHPAKGLVDETNAALLTQKFWVQAIYTELLCASSRLRAVEGTAEATQWVGEGRLSPL